MLPKRDNYAIQAEEARLRFLTYDQAAMPVQRDGEYLCLRFCGIPYRISRSDGHIFRLENSSWLHSCLENSMDRGAWWATVHGVAKS